MRRKKIPAQKALEARLDKAHITLEYMMSNGMKGEAEFFSKRAFEQFFKLLNKQGLDRFTVDYEITKGD